MRKLSALSLILLSMSTCGERLSPWETKVPSRLQNLTQRNLDRLQAMRQQPELPLNIAVLADPQGTPDDLREVVDTLNQRSDLSFILVLGDLTDYGLLHEYIWAAEALDRSQVPYLTVIGNHDALGFGKDIYQQMFGPLNYSFEWAGLKFVMFNSNHFEFKTLDFPWLASQVNSRSIVCAHVPPEGDTEAVEQLRALPAINRQQRALLSLYGHRGSNRGFLSLADGAPSYVVPRLRDEYYALLRIEPDLSWQIQSCRRKDCYVQAESENLLPDPPDLPGH